MNRPKIFDVFLHRFIILTKKVSDSYGKLFAGGYQRRSLLIIGIGQYQDYTTEDF